MKKIYGCRYCTATFCRQTVYRRHLLYGHKDVRHKCPYDNCDKTYYREKSMINHMTKVHKYKKNNPNISDDIFKNNIEFFCSKCEHKIYGVRNYVEHVYNEHKDIIYGCLVCGKTLDTFKKARYHSYKIHNLYIINSVYEPQCLQNEELIFIPNDNPVVITSN